MLSKYRSPLLVISLLILLGGMYTYKNIKTGLFPDITFPKIKVIADAGQQPVNKMMTGVTIPLENILRATEGLQYIRSTTSRGTCEISVFLDWNTDIDIAKSQIESFINQSKGSLLPDVSISTAKMNPSILPVMGYSLEGDASLVELKKIAKYQIRPYLASTPGVSDIAIIGGRDKELQIILKQEVLSALGISIAAVKNAITNSNVLESDGYVTAGNRMYLTLVDNAIEKAEDLENLVVLTTPERTIHVKDLATVKIAEAKQYVKILANGKNVPLIAVVKQPNANLIDLNNAIELKVQELGKLLPKGIRLVPYYKQADFVNTSIKSIKDVLWIGLALALVIVILFLRSVTASLVVLFTIPVSLALTLIVLDFVGYTFNIMTLGAIAAAIGLIIDDIVIVIEQIHKIREENPEKSTSWVLIQTIDHLLPAMIGSSLSTMVIFIPFVLMTGVAGAYFKVMAFSMIIALACSFFVTWLISPVLYLFFSRTKPLKGTHVIKTKWIHFFLKRPPIGMAFIVVCIIIITVVPGHLPSGFLPEMDEGSIVLDFNSPPGTTLEETDRMLGEVNMILDKQPEVAAYSARLGTQMGFFITEPNRGDYLIKLKDSRKRSTDQVADAIRTKIENTLPQLTVDFGQVIGDMLGDLMSSVQPIEIKIFGDDTQELEKLSGQIADQVAQVRGTADVNNGIIIAGPEVILTPKEQVLTQLGMTPADLQLQLNTFINGIVVSSFIDNQQLINIRMLFPSTYSNSISNIKDMSILLPSGAVVPIGKVATIHIEKGVAEINRESQKSMGVITARLNNRDLGSTLKDIRSRLKDTIKLPFGYTVVYGGEYQAQQQAFKELLLILASAILLVFIVTLFLFKKVKISVIILSVSIQGIAGCFFSLYVTGTPLNVGSYMGIIMIVGIIGENSIFTYRQFQEADPSLNYLQKIEFAVGERLRPKLMTAFAAIAALIPLSLGLGVGAQLHQPLAIAVIGGLFFALPLLLVVFPTLLAILKDKH